MSNNDKQKQARNLIIRSAIIKLLSMVSGTFLLIMGVVILFIIIIASVLNADFDTGTGIGGGTKPLPEHVESVRPLVEAEAEEQGISEYTDIILAMIAQESGGNPDVVDIMQASESMCGGEMGCISSTEESIKYGVSYFKEVLEKANNDVLLTLQSYNFGIGFIDFANEHNDGKYSKEVAIKFSQKMFEDSGRNTELYTCLRAGARELDACYGDIQYVEAVTAYYSPNSADPLENVSSPSSSTDSIVAGSIEDIEFSSDMDITRSSGNTYLAGHCTFFAYEIRKAMGQPIPNTWGDADTWDDRASEDDNFEVSKTPSVGAVYQLDRGGRDCCYEYGHIGVVTEVFDNGEFIVTEMNWGGEWKITSRKLSPHKDDNFIT